MVTQNKTSPGYVALLAVLVMGAVTLASGLALLMSGTDNQRTALVDQQSAQARGLAAACAEKALQTIHDTTTYTGSSTETIDTQTCSYTVTSTGTNTRIVDSFSTIDNATRRVKVYVTISTTSISVTSWQEVGDA
jgi:hypothetical protein